MMLAALDRNRQQSLARASFSIAHAIETFLDPVIIVGSLFATAFYQGEAVEAPYILLALIVFSLSFPGTLNLADNRRRMMRKTVMNWGTIALILLAFGYATGYERFFPDRVLYGWIGTCFVALLVAQQLAVWALPKVLENGNQSTAIIVGGNEIGVTLARQFEGNQYLGIRLLGFFDDRSRERLGVLENRQILGRLAELAEYVKTHHVEHIYLALPMASQPRILTLLEELKDTTASIFFVPDIFVTDLIQGRMDSINGMPVVAVCETPFTGVNGMFKRLMDVLLSLIIIVLISPVLLFCAIGVKLSSPGSIIFRQRRYGLDGKEIVVFKFRSMTVCEDGAVVTQATKNDQRVTRFGAFLRRTSLDELPQFFNVLQGTMSIVGPRPHAVAHNESYRKLIKGYMVRHKVKPGITGWAQVCGCRGETETIDKMEKRIEYDLEYLRTWSITLDLWIIIKTVLVVLTDRKAY
ncbi:undecaprenyl-phosphate glucose phosphotransferase [Viridibacterium curvum]|uniref:Exopolysaccharide biosynthesis glycosyltransferase VpsL n=1 Tax=Viridibacterium curvum TaxID=1101404 RepID=A0ABP9R066_9RHOO